MLLDRDPFEESLPRGLFFIDLASLVVLLELSMNLLYSGEPIFELIAEIEPPVGILSKIRD